MRNWLAGVIAFAGLVFFFLVERNIVGFIILIVCAVAAAILFSEREMDERVKKLKERQAKGKMQFFFLFFSQFFSILGFICSLSIFKIRCHQAAVSMEFCLSASFLLSEEFCRLPFPRDQFLELA